MKIYVAGAYQADSEDGIIENITHAAMEAEKLWHKGFAVICPHLNSALMSGDRSMFIKGGLEMLKDCQAIYMLKGFRQSKGAMEEYNQALKDGLEIYYET